MAIPTSFTFDKNNSEYFEWGPIVDGRTETLPNPTYLNDLTVVMTLSLNDEQCGEWPLVYEASSNGLYAAQIPTLADLPSGSGYVVQVVAQSDLYYREWTIPASVE